MDNRQFMNSNFDYNEYIAKQSKVYLQQIKMNIKSIEEAEKHYREEKLDDGSPKYSESEVKNLIGPLLDGLELTYAQYYSMGGTEEEIKAFIEKDTEDAPVENNKEYYTLDDFVKSNKKTAKPTKKEPKKKEIKEKKNIKSSKNEILEKVADKPAAPVSPETLKHVDETEFIPKMYKYDPIMEFDVVPLPSRGECYSTKNKTIPVSPLNATDENVLTSPNVYRHMKLIDIILKRKIVGDIDPNDLIDADRDAIALWLRATGYGNEYPVSVKDPETQTEFETTIDLSEVKFKPFNLKGDEKGWFDFTLPISGDKIKFQFLSHGEKAELAEIDKFQTLATVKAEVSMMPRDLDIISEECDEISDETKKKLRDASNMIADSLKEIDLSNASLFTDSTTNKLIYSIMAINGNEDREYIENYVTRMPVKDSLALRRYITDNEPAVDFNFVVNKPESLGGGSMPVFLSINQFIFLNVPSRI